MMSDAMRFDADAMDRNFKYKMGNNQSSERAQGGQISIISGTIYVAAGSS